MTDTVAEIEDDTSAVQLDSYAPIPLAHKFGKEGHVTRKRIVIPGDGNDAVFYLEVTGIAPDRIEYKIISPEEFSSSEPQGEVLEPQSDEADPETYDVEEKTDETDTKEELEGENEETEEEETQKPEDAEIDEGILEDFKKMDNLPSGENPVAIEMMENLNNLEDVKNLNPEDETEKKEDTPETREFEIDDAEAPEDMQQLANDANDVEKEEDVLPDFDYPYETDAGKPIAGFLIPIDENTSPAFIMVEPELDSEGKPTESAKEAMARVRLLNEQFVDADLQMVIDRTGNDPLSSGE